MQEPSTAAGAPDYNPGDRRSSPAEPDIELDGDLRSLVDGVAMLGRFESELADYESSLGDVRARSS